MSKKKNDKIDKIIKNKDKGNLKNKIFLMINLFIIGLLLLKNYISNDGIIEKILSFIINIINVLFGKTSLLFFVFVAIINSYIIFLGNRKIRKNYLIRFFMIMSYVFFAIFITSLSCSITATNFLDSGQDLLSFGFTKSGSGILGSIFSMPFYLILNENWFTIVSLLLSLICFVLGFGKYINILFKMISKTYLYYSSEEYTNKKKLIKAKEEYYKFQIKQEEDKEIEEMTQFLVVKSDVKLEKEIAKDPNSNTFFNEKELEEKKKEWQKFYERIEAQKEKDRIEKINNINKVETETFNDNIKEKKMEFEVENSQEYVTLNTITDIEDRKIEKKNIIEEIEEDSEKKVEDFLVKELPKEEKLKQDLEPLKREEIKQSIEEIFLSKDMDPEKKEEMKREISKNINLLEDVLYNFGVEAKVVDYATGPTVTRYEVQIPNNVKVKRVTELESEISMNLRAESIRIEAPIPGKAAIGIETPNKIKEPVFFSNLIHSPKLEKGILPVILGKDIVGREKIIDIAKLPHLLIGGTTGSGKSICINTIIASLISKKTDDEVKLIMIDPKMVELMPYNNIPHLLTPVIIDPNMAAIALKWAVNEMENRYQKLSMVMERNIEGYNERFKNDKMPYIVIIIDELADLMMVSANSVETSIARLAQKARAIGIHLIVATQRPSTDVVTGLIKSNLPSRIAFTLRSYIDSRTVLDQVGAEKLLGKGDMLFLDNGKFNLERVQGAYISDEEVVNLTNLLRSKKRAVYNEEVLKDESDNENSKIKDPLFDKAVMAAKKIEDRAVSISYIQTELGTGFPRASKLIKQLKEYQILDESNMYIGE